MELCETSTPQSFCISTLTFYVVDDDWYALQLYECIFQDTGAKVHLFNSSEELLAAVRVQRPDVVLADVMMPRLDGWEMLVKLRELPDCRNLPILFSTSLFSEDEAARLSYSADACRILPKPLQKDRLLASLASLLRHKDW